ncbi:hypothetical protein GCM10010106_24350 [Thermopolyspora flexuosa]|nr:hypothetical protein GCM10010106_24350 [Thermopolyspora flexuosa]
MEDTVAHVLPAAIGTALVDAVTGDAWRTVKARMVALWRRYRETDRTAGRPRKDRGAPLTARPQCGRRPSRRPGTHTCAIPRPTPRSRGSRRRCPLGARLR